MALQHLFPELAIQFLKALMVVKVRLYKAMQHLVIHIAQSANKATNKYDGIP